MEKIGCPKCGRHPEEEALVCSMCGLEMPTKGHRRAIFMKSLRKIQNGGTRFGLGVGIILGPAWPTIASAFNAPWLYLYLPTAIVGSVLAWRGYTQAIAVRRLLQ